ncbi:MAG: hypothetical protein GXY05_15485 [Clostridiales bacterium]|nr:hypothetical protein [Clostridiales bacterium]
MPDHYADMGIRIEGQEEMERFVFDLARESRIHKINSGILGVANIDDRVEFWIAGNEEGQIEAVSFNAVSSNRNLLKIDRIVDEDDSPIPTICAWYSSEVAHRTQDDYGIEYPIVFEAVNYGLRKQTEAEEIIQVQLTAFANNMSIYEDDKAYYKLSNSPMAPESFIPSGTFTPDGNETDPPTADAIFCGHILYAERLFNSKGGLWYWHIAATCQGCVFDILASDELAAEAPKAGGVVSGSFWLSGKIFAGTDAE